MLTAFYLLHTTYLPYLLQRRHAAHVMYLYVVQQLSLLLPSKEAQWYLVRLVYQPFHAAAMQSAIQWCSVVRMA